MIIRLLALDDLPRLTPILSDPEVMRYSVKGVCNELATRKFIEWCLGCYASHGVGPWALVDKASGKLMGFSGVSPEVVADVEEINLGYRLARDYWDQGFATESAAAVLHHTFSRTDIESVVVIIDPAHVASLRVAQKVGFKQYRSAEFHGRPVRLYRLSREQWHALPTQTKHPARYPSQPIE